LTHPAPPVTLDHGPMHATQAPPLKAPPAAAFGGVTFSYDDRLALDGLSLTVPSGTIFGLLGPNGSGKSTLLSLIAGLRTPAAGSVEVFGSAPEPATRAAVAFVFQETSVDPLMTVREALWLHGRLYGMGGAALREAIGDALATVGLSDRSRALIKTLSGGMKRRLEIARALLPKPALLVLDEPTTGLDPDSDAAVWDHLLQINRTGVTVLLATNDVDEADRHCGAVAFIHQGRVVAQGSPAELKAGLKRDGVWVEGDFDDDLIRTIRALPGVGRLTWAAPLLHATVDSASTFVPALFQAAGDRIRSVRLRESTLEDAYFEIVGSGLTNGSDR
jgi:ABC-2 type transport system ATP-binding protein